MDWRFIDCHKTNASDFSRKRKFQFADVFTLILRKSTKSLQVMLNEFALWTQKSYLITASAFTQARKKLQHTAFSALNDAIVSMYYKEQPFKRWKGLRVLGVDASKLILPKNEEIKMEFGARVIANGTENDCGEYCSATLECCYDVLNHIAVKSVLSHGDAYEVNVASKMLEGLNHHDLLIFDRGYASYTFMANLSKRNIHYVIRCSKSSFAVVNNMFKKNSKTDVIAKLKMPSKKVTECRAVDWPSEIKVRVVKVILSSGETEVLVTSLLNRQDFKKEYFKELYFLRWGVESFFLKLKSRLSLENFTGKSVEAIKQDFWSTIFLSNLESMMTEEVEQKLQEEAAEAGKQKPAINRAVSFNAIKNLAFDLLCSKKDTQEVMEQLIRLFLMNTRVVREGKTAPRRKIPPERSCHYQKRIRKQIF